MLEPVSALMGKVVTGPVTIRDLGLRGMITLRGDLQDAGLQAVCTAVTGARFPVSGQAEVADDKGLIWMSPDEVLVLVPYAGVAEALARCMRRLILRHHRASRSRSCVESS